MLKPDIIQVDTKQFANSTNPIKGLFFFVKNLAFYTPLAYNLFAMIILETSVFTKQITTLLTDEEYRLLQTVLVNRPDAGSIIKGSGGLRKIRWKTKQSGKRGGFRVIYYWAVSKDRILMLFIYPKTKQSDLTPAQIKVLRKIVKEEYK
jgi:mRNA-degrading endonuclease RelE of RelBE toxin-antitoxin system